MKTVFYNLLTLAILISIYACGQPNNNSPQSNAISPEMAPIFEAHGGYGQWDKMKSLSFEIVKEEGINEKQHIQLKDRREWIKGENFEMGYDGTQTWVRADTSYKGDPLFYKNLMFYFYAMPFVLGDEGINYKKVEPLQFEGQSYPGIGISYNEGVGLSPKDEYYIYYDANTHEMQWLAYTVTYFSNEKSDKLGWIRYNDWGNYSGLKLPNTLSWYNSENGVPTELRNTREFSNIMISDKAPEDEIFAMPADAKVAE